ncbi:uncharacterized protein MICPUCDRAFT_58101 [Micromonas pusilla CCMP1545]|uniref:Predicted protein n=1 Tax=Micromonas pusilla (strain CCMP1545) TaxID=564608 RepID=C1MTK1_MICPC|nr:uncharacterized protein MICPUCDRAFT_58101 [Micromonas pusilla CCMP1545]EEH57331.1 predicted protein [Micromonas pusilla CCMP1545]|eukprot:XP_003058876.1 predicted protein [Micromonas pusilla CCMP1545]
MPRFGHKMVAADAREEMTAYEAERAARIEANKARMRDLGILDATARLRATDAAAAARRAAVRAARTPKGSDADGNPAYRVADRAAKPAVATRRSGRLSGASPDDAATTTRTTDRDDDVDRNPETYSPAQVAALGSATKTWTLFVDGYDANGNRIYDSAIGATCHQCRQKTVCAHTSCGGCGELRGQFCGDCLWMRYGEHVDEANALGAKWRCPPCRDLCNCSFCRQRKGWPPTGTLYRRAIKEGYASVAHYLVLNNRADEDVDVKTRGGAEEEGAADAADAAARDGRSPSGDDNARESGDVDAVDAVAVDAPPAAPVTPTASGPAKDDDDEFYDAKTRPSRMIVKVVRKMADAVTNPTATKRRRAMSER